MAALKVVRDPASRAGGGGPTAARGVWSRMLAIMAYAVAMAYLEAAVVNMIRRGRARYSYRMRCKRMPHPVGAPRGGSDRRLPHAVAARRFAKSGGQP